MTTNQTNTIPLRPLVHVVQAEVTKGYRVQVTFEDGTSRESDLDSFLAGPIFEPLRRDPVLFQQMMVRGGTLAWPNGTDIDPDVPCYGLTPVWMEVGEGV